MSRPIMLEIVVGAIVMLLVIGLVYVVVRGIGCVLGW